MRCKAKTIICFLLVICTVLLGTILVQASRDMDEIELAGFNNVTDFYASNRYTFKDPTEQATSQVNLDLGTSVVELDTEIGKVYVDKETLAFQFESENGYIWSSTVNYDKVEENGLNEVWQEKVRSAVIINSFNTKSLSNKVSENTILNFDTGGASVDFDEITNGFEAKLNFKKEKIKLTIDVTFTKKGIIVNIPSDSIEENGTYLLKDLTVYPYFGGVLEDNVPGYTFIPDGTGALVRYKKAINNIQSNYEKSIYGKNLGYSEKSDLNQEITKDASIHAPIFGFVHGVNQNAIFGIIESGAEYASLNLEYAGKLTKYQTVYSKYTYRQVYKQPIDKAGNTISLLQEKKNDVDIKIKYQPLSNDSANYVGMANYYREYLQSKNSITQKEKNDAISLKLETIGLEKTKGVLFDKSIVMTTFDEYQSMIKELKENGITNITGVFDGFTSNGVSWVIPNYKKFSKKLGSKSNLAKLVEDDNIYFTMDFQKGTTKGGGFNTYFDLAKKINDQRYTYNEMGYTAYLLKHHVTKKLYKESISKLSKYKITNFNVANMGNLLYADYDKNVKLGDAIKMYNELLASTKGNVSLSRANDYLWSNMDEYFDFPMYSSQYLHFDDTVPFLSITLGSLMNIYSSNANFYAYPREELLRLVDFNVYPSFIVTNKSSQKLQKTNLNEIYSSRYVDLKTAIIKYYDFVNEPLQHVIGETLVSRDILEVGVVVNTYSNGVKIIVNYTNKVIPFEANQIEAMSYLVIGGEN